MKGKVGGKESMDEEGWREGVAEENTWRGIFEVWRQVGAKRESYGAVEYSQEGVEWRQ